MAECLPRSNHESTYLAGSKRVSGGPTNLINKSEADDPRTLSEGIISDGSVMVSSVTPISAGISSIIQSAFLFTGKSFDCEAEKKSKIFFIFKVG
jgi:hypothetical protein